MIKLIVGIGNPGKEYSETRHNAGIWAAFQLADKFNISLKPESKFSAYLAKSMGENSIYLAAPTTYMNESGIAVKKIASYFNIKPEEILIIHDELDLDVGTIKAKKAGGHAGHNGLRSITQHLGTNDFYRLRIGISHPGDKNLVSNYVLGKPSKSDRQTIDDSIYDAVYHIETLLDQKLESFNNDIRKK